MPNKLVKSWLELPVPEFCQLAGFRITGDGIEGWYRGAHRWLMSKDECLALIDAGRFPRMIEILGARLTLARAVADVALDHGMDLRRMRMLVNASEIHKAARKLPDLDARHSIEIGLAGVVLAILKLPVAAGGDIPGADDGEPGPGGSSS